MKTNNKKPPHEKPILIPLEFEDAVKQILSVQPPQKYKVKKRHSQSKQND